MAQAKINRKHEKKMKENLIMLDDERRHADQYKEQAEKVNLKNHLNQTNIAKLKVLQETVKFYGILLSFTANNVTFASDDLKSKYLYKGKKQY